VIARKRIPAGISALIGKEDGKLLFALVCRAAPDSVLRAAGGAQHCRSWHERAEVVEAPRVFSWGLEAEVERGISGKRAQRTRRART